MFNINKNTSLYQLEELVKKDLQDRVDYLPESFYEEQKKVLEIFKKRIELEKIIEETITFNKKINWKNNTKNLYLVKTAEELIDVFKLRSDIYAKYGYSKEFPDTIDGLSFDNYDTHSAIIYYKTDNSKATGSIRLIIGTEENKLPTEDKIDLQYLKNIYSSMGEISKLVVDSKRKGLNLEFKYLLRGVYEVFFHNNIEFILSAIKTSDFKLYKKLGNFELIKEIPSYGKIKEPFSVISYDPISVSDFSKKSILS
eukprot:gnl/Chilomastix_cuspidata/8033.p1 GENE.gnl/Chilomastix_cuspidata/8033~~gnl/Chilomastix_cuspidata/8033.p1  ORF type:complete len:262 (-),score=38.31 gnl/Chilomastix_cuspidata/8033:945-1709(-)